MIRVCRELLFYQRQAALECLLVAGEARSEELCNPLVEALRLPGHGRSSQQKAQQQCNAT